MNFAFSYALSVAPGDVLVLEVSALFCLTMFACYEKLLGSQRLYFKAIFEPNSLFQSVSEQSSNLHSLFQLVECKKGLN